jgi:tripartite-type tricarboxylate transporter receptor subunit TctC
MAMVKGMNRTTLGFVIALSQALMPTARSQGWAPQRNVEFIVPTASGSSMDVLARAIADLWQQRIS